MNNLKNEISEIKTLSKTPEIKAFFWIFGLQSMVNGWTFGVYSLNVLSLGMSLFQLTLLNTAFMLTDTFFNPYAGKLADKHGQKKIFIIGQFFWALGMLVYGIGRSFGACLVAEIIAAIGAALMSDALESWLRNEVGEEKTHKALSQSGLLSMLGVIPAAILGGVIGAKLGFGVPFLVSGILGLVVLVISIKILKDFEESFDGEEPDGVWEVLKQNFRSADLKKIALVTFVISVAIQPFNMFWAPIFEERSGQAWWLGFLWIGIMVMSSIGSVWAKKQNNGLGIVKMVLIIGVPMIFAPMTKSTLAIVGLFLLHEAGRGSFRPIMFTFANKHIANKNRSTANSIMSAMKTVGSAAGLLLFGFMTKFISPVNTWGVAATILLVLALWTWKKKE